MPVWPDPPVERADRRAEAVGVARRRRDGWVVAVLELLEAGEERGHDVGVGGGDVGVLGRVGLDVEEADLPRSWRPSPMA